MRKVLFMLILAVVATSLPASATDYKIKTKRSMMNFNSEDTLYLKGQRKRTEAGTMFPGQPQIITIEQCDLRRIIQYNPKNNTCMVTPMDVDVEPAAATPKTGSARTKPAPAESTGPTKSGGTVTISGGTTDTKERKQMFGFTARHLKSSMSVQSSPDACASGGMEMDKDGWYADINPTFTCPSRPMTSSPMGSRGSKPSCQDHIVFKGAIGHLPFALKETTTMKSSQGTFTMSEEVEELSTATIDPSLMDMPKGCRVVTSYNELAPMDMTAMMQGMRNQQKPQEVQREESGTPEYASSYGAPEAGSVDRSGKSAKRPGVVRVCVVKIGNDAGGSVDTPTLRDKLSDDIMQQRLEAVNDNANPSYPDDVISEAKQKQCDYVLYTNIKSLKKSGGGWGGALGRAAGVGGGEEKYEANLAYQLVRVSDGQTRLDTANSAKGTGSSETVIESVLTRESHDVAVQVMKDARGGR